MAALAITGVVTLLILGENALTMLLCSKPLFVTPYNGDHATLLCELSFLRTCYNFVGCCGGEGFLPFAWMVIEQNLFRSKLKVRTGGYTREGLTACKRMSHLFHR